METAIVSLVCVALIVFGGMTMSRGFISTADNTAMALDTVGQREQKMMRTELEPTYAGTSGGRALINVYLTNTGQTKLTDPALWDVFVQYYDWMGNYYVTWLPYTSGALANNQWTITGIYWDDDPEVFEPGILNPGEEIRIQARVSPIVGRWTTNLVVVSTPNGVPASIAFYQG